MNTTPFLVRVTVILLAMHAAGYAFAASSPAAAGDDALRLYDEAVAAMSSRAVFAPPDRRLVVEQSLGAYLAKQDAYSGYMSRDEYRQYLAVRTGTHGGLGMDLVRRHDGETLCYPYPGGPAARAGIEPAARLLAIAGTPVLGKPLPALAALAAGAPQSTVVVELSGAHGNVRRVTVTRGQVDEPTVTTAAVGKLRVIRIPVIGPGARGEIELAVQRLARHQPIILDLRGCGGGDFHEAVNIAMLFLDKGKPIVSVKGRTGAQVYTSTVDRPAFTQPVYVWQDENTASAAEILVGALTDNGRAVSIGRRSGGKGSRQDIVELADGSALVLTTGYLYTPNGTGIDGRGLPPMRPLGRQAGDAAFARATRSTE